MNDYRKIRREDTGRLQPKHTAMLHADSRLALTQFLAGGDPARSIVITHHAPSIRSLPEHKHAEPISAAYASNLDDLIAAAMDGGARSRFCAITGLREARRCGLC